MTKFFDLAQCFQGSTITYQYFILLYSHIIFRRMAIPHFIYPLVDDIWIVYSFGLLWIVLLCTFMYRFLCGHTFSFSCILRRQLLCHIVTFFFLRISKLFCKAAALVYIPTRNIKFSSSLTLVIVCLFFITAVLMRTMSFLYLQNLAKCRAHSRQSTYCMFIE